MTTQTPLPEDLQARLDVLVLKRPYFRRAPRLAEMIAGLVTDAYNRPRREAYEMAVTGAAISDYLDQHRGETVTAEQVSAATGASVSGARAFLEAWTAVAPARNSDTGMFTRYSPEPSAETEGAAGPANAYNPAPRHRHLGSSRLCQCPEPGQQPEWRIS